MLDQQGSFPTLASLCHIRRQASCFLVFLRLLLPHVLPVSCSSFPPTESADPAWSLAKWSLAWFMQERRQRPITTHASGASWLLGRYSKRHQVFHSSDLRTAKNSLAQSTRRFRGLCRQATNFPVRWIVALASPRSQMPVKASTGTSSFWGPCFSMPYAMSVLGYRLSESEASSDLDVPLSAATRLLRTRVLLASAS